MIPISFPTRIPAEPCPSLFSVAPGASYDVLDLDACRRGDRRDGYDREHNETKTYLTLMLNKNKTKKKTQCKTGCFNEIEMGSHTRMCVCVCAFFILCSRTIPFPSLLTALCICWVSALFASWDQNLSIALVFVCARCWKVMSEDSAFVSLLCTK